MKHPLLHTVLQTLLLAAILGCLVLLMARHPWRVDMTPDRRFTLSAHTHEVLDRLFASFYEAILHDRPLPISTRDMLRVSRMLDEIFRQVQSPSEGQDHARSQASFS